MNTLSLLLLVASSFSLHDDDPKRLDRVPPYQGPAWRSSVALAEFTGGVQSSFLGGGLSSPNIHFPSDGVRLLSWIPLGEFGPNGAVSGNDCWGYVSPSGTEYAIIGTSNGTGFVNIDNPGDAQLVEFIPGPGSLWRDIKTYSHYAYAVSEGGEGIQVIDLSQIDNGVVTHVNTVTSGGTNATHNVVINEESGYLYRCGGGGRGLRVYNLNNNPQNPQYVGSWNTRYVHDAQIVTMSSGPYAGQELAFCCSGYNNGGTQTGLDILNVTNKNNITEIDRVFYSTPAYSHQGWLNEDRSIFYLGDELDESGNNLTRTHIIDVSNPNSGQDLGYFTNQSNAIGHNLYTRGDLLFAANYRSGLRIFDITQPLSPAEVAHFDVWPADDIAEFNGLWSCYPYFPSGTVIGSDLEKGLFVWWVGDPLIELASATPERISPQGETLEVQISEQSSGVLDMSSPKAWWDTGAGWQSSAMSHQGGDAWTAQLPVLECGEDLTWFLAASSTNGVLWTYPPEAPHSPLLSTAAEVETVITETNFETPSGWTSGFWDDDATSGFWTLGNPTSTPSQPGDDHSPVGTRCWYTGADSDVDGGRTSLVGPVWDLSQTEDPVISFWMWVNLEDGAPSDHTRVQVSNNGGFTWVTIDNMIHPEPETRGVWTYQRYHIKEFISLDLPLRIRIRANDLNLNSNVEAAVDDLRLVDLGCGCPSGGPLPDCLCSRNNYCEITPNSVGAGARISSAGSLSLLLNDFELTAEDAAPNQFSLFFYGGGQTSAPFGDGTLCVSSSGAGVFRFGPPGQTNANGKITRTVNWNAAPTGAGPGAVTPGTTWNYQLWYRDPSGPGGSGFNLSDALSATLCP